MMLQVRYIPHVVLYFRLSVLIIHINISSFILDTDSDIEEVVDESLEGFFDDEEEFPDDVAFYNVIDQEQSREGIELIMYYP